MALTVQGRVLLAGRAAGPLLVLRAPISFWGGVDPATGAIVNAHHPDRARSVAGTILALPGTIGSSGGSGILLELLYNRTGPAGLILAEPDAILALGAVVAREMEYATIPVLQAPLEGLESGRMATIGEEGTLIVGQSFETGLRPSSG